MRGDVGQHVPAQGLEYAPVAEEARNRDVAASVEHLPLAGIILQSCSIGGEIRKLKVLHAPLEAFAHPGGAPFGNLALDPRQRPLQEDRAIRIVHAVGSSNYDEASI